MNKDGWKTNLHASDISQANDPQIFPPIPLRVLPPVPLALAGPNSYILHDAREKLEGPEFEGIDPDLVAELDDEVVGCCMARGEHVSVLGLVEYSRGRSGLWG